MAEPIYFDSKVLAAKIEAAYGTNPVPTGAANGILANKVSIQPMEGEDVSRELERPYHGAQETVAGGLYSSMTFSTELAGSGAAGTAPQWGVFARAAAMAETISAGVSVAYTPITNNKESCAIYFWIGATKHVFLGTRGKGDLMLDAGQIPHIQWTMYGLWTQPTESAADVPDLSGWQTPLVASKVNTPTFTVNAVPLVLRSYKLSLANDVKPRILIGREEIIIPDRAEELSCQVEAVPLTTLNPFALAKAGTKFATSLVHGTAAGNIVTVATPTAQMKRPNGYAETDKILEWPLTMTPLPSAGDDQFSITLT